MLHVVFTEEGIPGWIGTEPRLGSELLEKEVAFLVAHRSNAKGDRVKRSPPLVVLPIAEEPRASA